MTKFPDLERVSRTGDYTYTNLPKHTSPGAS